MSSGFGVYKSLADCKSELQEVRRAFVNSVDEFSVAMLDIYAENESLRLKIKDIQSEASRLRSQVSNFEKIISARDRFGCWLCAKHERESVEEDGGEEKEVLRYENLALRGEIKRLQHEVSCLQRDRSPTGSQRESTLRPALRSSLRSSDEADSRTADQRRIRFSQRQSISCDKRLSGRFERPSLTSSRGSVSSLRPSATKKVSLDAPPSPEHKKSPLMSFTTAALVMNAVQNLKSMGRKSRNKQALFGAGLRAAWAVKFSPLERQISGDEIDQLIHVMSGIDVCRSAAETQEDLQAIAQTMTAIRVGAGDTVCKQGEAGLFFMVISQGEFLCESLGAPTRDLGPSDFFGDEIFVHPFPVSSVSVTCTSPDGGTLWAIHTDALRHVLKSSAIRQTQLARGTLDCIPKVLRDSMNATQFASICLSASVLKVDGLLEKPAGCGLLVVVEAAVGGNDVPGGSVVMDTTSPITVSQPSRFLYISQREIDSIPPLAVALASLPKDKSIVEGSGTVVKGQGNQTPTSSVTPPDEPPYHHPLSPSLRPDLTESDIENVFLFSLLSLSTRTHLVNGAQFITISYDTDEPPIRLNLGVVLVLNGTAVVEKDGAHLLLDQGHAAGLGQGNPQFTNTVQVDADRNTFDLDGNVPPPVVLAYWPDAHVRAALPPVIRAERDEPALIAYLKKRKLLIRNPIFQFLPDSGVEHIIITSRSEKLDHNRALAVSVSPDQAFVVIDGSVTVNGPLGEVRLGLGEFWNAETLVNGSAGVNEIPASVLQSEDAVESNKSEESENPTVVTCHSVRSEIMLIAKTEFRASFGGSPDEDVLVSRIQENLKSMRERIDLQDVKIGKTIGRGGTAVVKIATVPKESENGGEPMYYALKVIKKKLLEKHNKLGLLKNEKFVMQQLESDFIVKLRATFKDSRNLYFLLELAPGGDLLSIINALGGLKREQAQFYLGCMVRALQHCHQRGIVYRDLKAENLLVDAQGYVKLADFGVAKKIPPKSGMTTYSLVGTPQFMAPEVILGKGYGLSADLWSLGCCLYEFMAGELPFQAEDQFELFQKILHFNPEKIEFGPEIDDESRDLIRKLLQLDPHKRIGCSVGLGITELESHAFFSGTKFTWEALDKHILEAPFVPQIRPLSAAFASDSVSEAGTEEAVPSVSPALSAVSWASFDHPRPHAESNLACDF